MRAACKQFRTVSAPVAHPDGSSANLDQLVGQAYTQFQHGCTPFEPANFHPKAAPAEESPWEVDLTDVVGPRSRWPIVLVAMVVVLPSSSPLDHF